MQDHPSRSGIVGVFDPLRDIVAFHRKFGLEYNGPPRELPEELAKFRLKFLVEELCEYTHGMPSSMIESAIAVFGEHQEPARDDRGLAEKLDALVDLMYVLLGTAYLHGFNQFGEAWNRVHEANMNKVRCKRPNDSLRNSTFDVIKPKGWRAADLSDLVR